MLLGGWACCLAVGLWCMAGRLVLFGVLARGPPRAVHEILPAVWLRGFAYGNEPKNARRAEPAGQIQRDGLAALRQGRPYPG